jgi:hypothetical protein
MTMLADRPPDAGSIFEPGWGGSFTADATIEVPGLVGDTYGLEMSSTREAWKIKHRFDASERWSVVTWARTELDARRYVGEVLERQRHLLEGCSIIGVTTRRRAS